MISLFAGVRSDGTLLFIDDARSGLQMDCFCPVCKSPLVAKKGTVNDWHFAHQALQERPECKVGAMNLLRQLCKESVLASPPVHIPALHLSRQMPFGSEQIEVSHTRGALDGVLVWADSAALPDHPFAKIQTPDGVIYLLCMATWAAEQACMRAADAIGTMHVVCALPKEELWTSLRHEQLARDYVRHNMTATIRMKADDWRSPQEIGFFLTSKLHEMAALRISQQRATQAGARWQAPASKFGLTNQKAMPLSAEMVADIARRKAEILSFAVSELEQSARLRQLAGRSAARVQFADKSRWSLTIASDGVGRLSPFGLGRAPQGWNLLLPVEQVGDVMQASECYKSSGLVLDACIRFLAKHAIEFSSN